MSQWPAATKAKFRAAEPAKKGQVLKWCWYHLGALYYCIPRVRKLCTFGIRDAILANCLASDSGPSLDHTSKIHWASDNCVQLETFIGFPFKVAPFPLTAANNLPMQGALTMPITNFFSITNPREIVTSGFLGEINSLFIHSLWGRSHACQANNSWL